MVFFVLIYKFDIEKFLQNLTLLQKAIECENDDMSRIYKIYIYNESTISVSQTLYIFETPLQITCKS